MSTLLHLTHTEPSNNVLMIGFNDVHPDSGTMCPLHTYYTRHGRFRQRKTVDNIYHAMCYGRFKNALVQASNAF
jgi:hypothetical protein